MCSDIKKILGIYFKAQYTMLSPSAKGSNKIKD